MAHPLEQLHFWNVSIRVRFRVIIWFKVHDRVNNCTKCCKILVRNVWMPQTLAGTFRTCLADILMINRATFVA